MLLPWGSLLRAVAGAEPDGLRRLRGLCAPGATLEVVVSEADLDGASPEALSEHYAEAGFAVAARPAGAAEAVVLGTTWAKRLARSDPGRRFLRLSGVVTFDRIASGGMPAAGVFPWLDLVHQALALRTRAAFVLQVHAVRSPNRCRTSAMSYSATEAESIAAPYLLRGALLRKDLTSACDSQRTITKGGLLSLRRRVKPIGAR